MDNFQGIFIPPTSDLKTAYDGNAPATIRPLYPQQMTQYPTETITKMSNRAVPAQCVVCGDKSTGLHYGAVCCDGCKGFFRRSIRKDKKYICRNGRNCDVSKATRNQCRSCRLTKCYVAGMKTKSVQSDRDKTSRKLRGLSGIPRDLFIKTLLDLEVTLGNDQIILSNTDFSENPIATVNDIRESLKLQLFQIEEWSKKISAVSKLSLDDRNALLRACAGHHLLLKLAKRSLYLKDILLLANNSILFRRTDKNCDILLELSVNDISSRILDELVKPLTEVHIDDDEFACLKAILFFDPHAKGLENNEKIRHFRDLASEYLEAYIGNQYSGRRGRLSELLLTIPSIKSISDLMVGQIQYAQIFDIVQIDTFLEEILLGGTDKFPSILPIGEQSV